MNSLKNKTKKYPATFSKKNGENSSNFQKNAIDPEISGNLTQVERDTLKDLHRELSKLKQPEPPLNPFESFQQEFRKEESGKKLDSKAVKKLWDITSEIKKQQYQDKFDSLQSKY
jgi:hypothetical protein